MKYFTDAFLGALNLLFSFDPEVYFIIWVSFNVSIAATILSAVVGLPIGIAVALAEFPGKRGVLLVLNTLMALPTVVVGLIFYGLLSRSGPLGDLALLFTPEGMVAALFVLALPIVVNLSSTAVRGLDPRLVVTCKSLGANRRQLGWKIIREGRFGIMSAVVVGFGRVISEVGIAMMIGGNIKGYTRTMTTAIALETSKGEFELGLALGMVLLLVALLVNAALFLLQRSKP